VEFERRRTEQCYSGVSGPEFLQPCLNTYLLQLGIREEALASSVLACIHRTTPESSRVVDAQ
jgi:hypothetical protein